MKWIKYKKLQYQQVINDLKQIKTLHDFFDVLSIEKLSHLAFFFVMIWSLIPILLMILSLFYDRTSIFSFMFNSSRLTIIWYMLMQQIGYLGFIMILLLVIKSLRHMKINRIPLKTYLIDHSAEILLMMFLLWSLISTLFSSNLALSFGGTDYRKDGWLSYLAYGGFYGIGYLLFRRKYIFKFLSTLVVVGSILGILLIINHEPTNELLTFHFKSTVFYNPNHMGYYLVLVTLSAAFLGFRKPKIDLGKVIFYILFSILTVSLIENGSFGPYLAVSAGLLFLLIMTFILKKSKLIHAISIAFLFLGITLVMNEEANFLSQETVQLTEGVGDIIEDNENAGSAGSGRWSLWTNALEFMIEKPVVGYGIENLEQAYLEVGITQDRPHNEFIQIGASIGIIGLILYIASLGFHFFDFLRIKKKSTFYIIGLFMIVFGYLVSTLFGNSMFYTTPYFMIIFGISRSFLKFETSYM